RAERRARQPIVPGRRAPPLQMAEDDAAALLPGEPLEFRRHHAGDAAEPLDVPGAGLLKHRAPAADRFRAFRRDDDAEARAELVSRADSCGDLLQVERDLRNENDVRSAGDAGVERNPS